MHATPEPRRTALPHRAGYTLLTFVVVAGLVYATAWTALSLLRHVVMPIVAIVVGFLVARMVFRLGGTRHPGDTA